MITKIRNKLEVHDSKSLESLWILNQQHNRNGTETFNSIQLTILLPTKEETIGLDPTFFETFLQTLGVHVL